MQEYKETRSTLPLLPGMPEECAKMDDLFADLQIVEEDRKPSVVITKKLESYGDLVCIERRKGDGNEVEKVKRLLVRGKPGAGKSSTVSKLAYDWACKKQDSPISEYQLLFAITINQIETDTDLIYIIQDQLLPKISRQSLENFIQSNCSTICVLFDGYDEATKYFHQCKDVRNILCSKWLADACVIVTTRPNEVGKFCQNYGPFTQVEVKGFSLHGRQKYVNKFFQMSEESESDMRTGEKVSTYSFFYAIEKSQRLYQLSFIPIILSMLCMLWVEDANLPVSVTSLYNEVIMHLAKHRFAKNTKDELDVSSIQTWAENVLFHIGKIAFEGLVEDKLVFKDSSFKKEQLEDACSLGIVIKERKRSRMSVTYHVTFLHKTLQEYAAALYWGRSVDTERKTFDQHLEQIREDNVFEMEYLLRFACGLSVKAAEIILPHVVQIMCQHDQLRDGGGDVRPMHKNTCQQIPLYLLQEAESNNTNIKESYKLHPLLKPLFSTLKALYDEDDDGEFFQTFLSYTTIAHDCGTVTQRNLPWLADVEHVDIQCASPVLCKAILSGFSQIANMIEQHNMSQLHSGQGAPDTETCLAIGNIERDRDTQGTGILQTGLNIEHLDLSCNNIGESVEKLGQAYQYMPCLRYLDLQDTNLNPSHCAALFDGFIAAGKMLSHQNEISSDTRVTGSGASQGGLIIEHLDLSDNVFGEAVEKLGQAYQYMPCLKRLYLQNTNLNPSHCAVLFDAFIAADTLSQQDEISSNTQGNGSGESQGGLSIEHLNLSNNDIGESVDKLLQALRYMPHLTYIRVRGCGLDKQTIGCIDEMLKQINPKFERDHYAKYGK